MFQAEIDSVEMDWFPVGTAVVPGTPACCRSVALETAVPETVADLGMVADLGTVAGPDFVAREIVALEIAVLEIADREFAAFPAAHSRLGPAGRGGASS